MSSKKDKEFLFVEKYRPQTIEDVILPTNLKNLFTEIVKGKEIQNMLLTGTQGSGKTTIAQALCREMKFDFITINGSSENGIDVLRNKIKNFASTVSAFDDGEKNSTHKVVIIEEADYLSNAVQPALRNFIEEYSDNCRFILTCNYKTRIIEPLHSRLSVVDFNKADLKKPAVLTKFLKRLMMILDNEGIIYSKDVLVSLIGKWAPDFRRIINEIQRYAIENSGTLDTGMLIKIVDLDVSSLIKMLKEKDFRSMVKWVSEHQELDFDVIVRRLFDNAKDYFNPQFVPHLVLILNSYQYKNGFVVDKEINTIAMMVELMQKGDFIK